MTKRIRRAWRRLVGSLAAHRQEVELAEEFESHLRMLTEENIRVGMAPEAARRRAQVTFGTLDAAKEAYRDQRGLPWLENLRRDVGYAWRGMRRNPGFAAVAVACLALGIGANTAIFSVANAVMVRSLPVSDPAQLVLLRYESHGDITAVQRTRVGDLQTAFPYAVFEALRERAHTLSGVMAWVPLGLNEQSLTVNAAGRSTVAGGEMVSGGYFGVLGVSPVLGRTIVDSDLEPGAPNVAVLSHRFWSRELGGNPAVVGAGITLNRVPFTIVGVMPPDFLGVDPAMPPDVWIALRDLAGLKPWGRLRSGPRGLSPFADRRYWWCLMMGRLAPGAAAREAATEVDAVFREAITEGLETPLSADSLPHIALSPGRRGLDGLRRSLSEPLAILTAAAGLVLLIACANVATLLLVRARAREREAGMRLALGASRSRLLRQFLTESALLSICGGVLGLLLARWGSLALVPLLAAAGRPIPLRVGPDAAVLAFAATVSVLAALTSGLVPALRATSVDPLRQISPGGARSSRVPLARVLVAGQTTLAVFLVFGAGLFVRTLQNLERQDVGFNHRNLLLFEIDPRRGGATIDEAAAIYERVVERLGTLPGARSVSLSANAMLSGGPDSGPVSTDVPVERSEETHGVYYHVVGPGFAETMGMQVLAGRGIDTRDIRERTRVAVVNETLARTLFPNRNPIGHRLSQEEPFDPLDAYEIVGVVNDVRHGGMRAAPLPTVYLPYGAQRERVARMWVAVRTANDPLLSVAAVRATMQGIDATLPVIDIRTGSDDLDRALNQEHLFATLSSWFGLLGLLLVSVGVYGTLAFGVTRRTPEIGVRMALGASPWRVRRLVLGESLLLAASGLAIGLPAALALSRFVASRLFGVTPYDAWSLVATAAVVATAAILAGLLPANQASRIDPLRALRSD